MINGVNGFLIESKSSESIEKAINKFIEKPEIIKKMGEESVNLIRKNSVTKKFSTIMREFCNVWNLFLLFR